MTTLQDVLDGFAGDLKGGKNDPTYLALVDAINASPDLAQQLNTAVANGTLTTIAYNPNSQGGDYDANGANGPTIELGGTLLQGLVDKANSTDASVAADGLSSLVSLVAHETWHANDAATVLAELNQFVETNGVPSNTSITQWVHDYRQFGLNDEAAATITAWNDAVKAATAANGGSTLTAAQLTALATGNDFAYPLFKLNADNSVSPISGVTQNADGTIDLSSSLSAVSSGLGLITPSTETTTADYLLFYTRGALSEAASLSSDPLTVSYNSLGLTTPSVSADLKHAPTASEPYDSQTISEWLASGTFSQKTTLLNTDDGSRATFEADAAGTGTTLTYDAPVNTDYQQFYEVLDIGHDGQLNFGHVVTIDFDGTTNVTLIGAGDTLDMSLANVVLSDNVSGTVNGDRNTISLHQGAALDLSGHDNLVKTASNEHVNLIGDGSSVTLQGPYGNITLEASHQTVTMGQGMVTAGNGLTGETIVGVPPSGTAGPFVVITVTAGTDDEFTVQNIGVFYNGGARNTLHASGGGYDMITVGEDSHLDITTSAGGYASATTSHSTVAFSGDTNGEVDGSNNTITVEHLTNLQLTGDDNSVDGSLDSIVLYGNDNNLALDDGAQVYIGFGSAGNVINVSRGTISGSSDGDETFVGSNNDFSYLSGGTFTITGDSNSLQMTEATVDIDGSNNILAGYDSTVNITGGSGDDVQLEDSTITAGDESNFLLSGDGNTVTTGTGTYTITAGDNNVTAGVGTFTIDGYDNVLSVGSGSSLSIDGNTTLTADHSDIVYQDMDELTQDLTGSGNSVQGAEGTYHIHGEGNHLAITDGSIYLDGATDGTTDISGSGNSVHADDTTIRYTGDSATGVKGANTGINIWGSGNTVLATDSDILLTASTGSTLTVNGTGNTIEPGYDSVVINVNGASMDDVTTLDLYESEATGNTGYYAVDGEDSTFHFGDGSHLHFVSYFSNILYVNNATIDMESDVKLVVYGNNNTFTGGNFTNLTITGTGNKVTTTDGNIVFMGDNTGDVVFGAGNDGANWSAPDPDLPPGDHGGYTPPGGNAVAGTASVDHLIQAMASFGSAGGAGVSQGAPVRQDDHMLVAAA